MDVGLFIYISVIAVSFSSFVVVVMHLDENANIHAIIEQEAISYEIIEVRSDNPY